jgi:hypothetical protein
VNSSLKLANYIIRQEFIEHGHYIQKFDMFTICKDLPEYKAFSNGFYHIFVTI